jgi:anti-sigma factor RsiW
MKWQCALLQRWLPEYPDGDLPAWRKRWLKAHVAQCPACRRELAALREVITAIQAAPAKDPGVEFWHEFSKEMHVKLVQAAQAGPVASRPSSSLWGRLPYLVGAPALAILLVWVAVQLTGPGSPVPNQALLKRKAPVQMAAVPRRAPAPSPKLGAVPAGELAEFVPVALDEGGTMPTEEMDISGWDLDLELAGMTNQEKEAFLKRVNQRAKDGSCAEELSYYSWA